MNDDRVRVLHGEVRQRLRELPACSVDCVVTSPPYWGLRDYGLPASTWGGRERCRHVWKAEELHTERGRGNWAQGTNGRGEEQEGGCEAARETAIPATSERATCSRCGAWRGCLGLEELPSLYVEHVVEVFREVRRVLKDRGTLWVNVGDTFVGGRNGGYGEKSSITSGRNHAAARKAWEAKGGKTHRTVEGLKPKDLVGIPWMVAFALRADGWFLRSDVIWHKPNPMPESVLDRPSRAHEYMFLLSKSRHYDYDADAIRTELSPKTRAPVRRIKVDEDGNPVGSNKRSVWRLDEVEAPDVWTIASEQYPHSHFATFPTALVRPCVLAGCVPGGTVLDPFGGSGTTGEVALELGRRALLVELSADYVDLIHRRLSGVQLPLVAPDGWDR